MDFIWLGGSLRYLLGRKEGNFITHEKELGTKRLYIKGSIETFLSAIKEYDMNVTLRAADDLRDFFDKIKEREIGSRLNSNEADELYDIISSLTKTFEAEARGIHSFFTTDKQISMDKLTIKHEALFPEKVFDELSEIAKYDVKEAGMCIAFERSTAAAFHILRATEEVLRNLYYRIVKQKRVKTLTWGNIIQDLSKKRKKPSETIMKNLDYIRFNFRNPTSHPDARHNIEEAQSLFNLCIDIISRMIKSPLWRQK